MDIEVLTIGTELLLGFTLDTNAQVLGQALAEAGCRVVRRTTVDDHPDRIREAVRRGLQETGAVLTTGGLGPTRDDVTKSVVAGLFDRNLVFRPEIWDDLVARFQRVGRPLAATNRCQAEVPEGATVLPNPRGTAPGLWVEGAPGLVILLPGVPREMAGLLRDEVLPRLKGRRADPPIQSLVVRTTGIPESRLAEAVAGIEEEIAPLTLAYLPGILGVDLRLTAWRLAPAEGPARLERAAVRLETLLAGYAYGRGEDDLAGVLLDRLRTLGMTLATAESCTGGGVGWRLTEIPGSSDVYLGGMVAYHNDAKTSLLGVPPALVQAHGAVSGQVAEAMACGARDRLKTDVAVAVTGVAGPAGGTESHPVGTVWFGIATPGHCTVHEARFIGNRHEIRQRTAQHALHRLLAWSKEGDLPK